MPQQPLPDWMKPTLDGRFNDLARNVSKLDDVVTLHCKHVEFEQQFKQELTPEQFKLILEWEEIMNYRHAIEMEWMYRAGLRDGMQMARTFYAPKFKIEIEAREFYNVILRNKRMTGGSLWGAAFDFRSENGSNRSGSGIRYLLKIAIDRGTSRALLPHSL